TPRSSDSEPPDSSPLGHKSGASLSLVPGVNRCTVKCDVIDVPLRDRSPLRFSRNPAKAAQIQTPAAIVNPAGLLVFHVAAIATLAAPTQSHCGGGDAMNISMPKSAAKTAASVLVESIS